MTKYSEKLIEECIKYFAEKHNHYINRETAIQYLDSLGGLFLAFSKPNQLQSEIKTK